VADEYPIPPLDLSAHMRQAPAMAEREGYLERGLATRRSIESMLPDDWSWEGKRVLDFGCGPGRAIRHLSDEAESAEIWGSDISAACIEWNSRNLSPSLSFVANDALPPLPFEDGKFDLVYALSVFTHIGDTWTAWLLEMDRILAPGGRLVATFMGEGMSEAVAGEPWDERNVGMNVYVPGQGWDLGGPMVLHSPWWIEEHWGRLFEIERIAPMDFFERAEERGHDNHGAVTAVKRDGEAPGAEELERPDPAEAREATALLHDVGQLRVENVALRAALEARPPDPPGERPVTGREGARAVWAAVKRRLP
jgi:SAM-dependent methyltransferase